MDFRAFKDNFQVRCYALGKTIVVLVNGHLDGTFEDAF